ncbi:hypothetical protein BJV78DRAFT_1285909 [Lactifluus subvellereus]|nr:hypothetical protein BJV78DRAFT_1285909 [Lactifluus subvellereus]
MPRHNKKPTQAKQQQSRGRTKFIPVPKGINSDSTGYSSSSDEALPDDSSSGESVGATKMLFSRKLPSHLRPQLGAGKRGCVRGLTRTDTASAFALITPPSTSTPSPTIAAFWDVLRITLDVTVHTAPPADTAIIPAALRSSALLSGAALLATLHTRSVRFFAPADAASNPTFLPAQVLVTLALSSAKIDSPRGGGSSRSGARGVLSCLSILPALGEWTYARQFLGYETELPARARGRECFASSLTSLHEQHLTSLIREPAPFSEPTTLAPKSTIYAIYLCALSCLPPPVRAQSAPQPSPQHLHVHPQGLTNAIELVRIKQLDAHSGAHESAPTWIETQHDHSNGHDHALAPLTSTLFTALPPPTSTAHDASSSSLSRAVARGHTGSLARRSRSQTPASTEPRSPGSWYALTRSVATVPGSSSGPWLVHAALRPCLRHAPLLLLFVVLPALPPLAAQVDRSFCNGSWGGCGGWRQGGGYWVECWCGCGCGCGCGCEWGDD